MSDETRSVEPDDEKDRTESVYGQNHPASDDRPEPDIREEIFKKSEESKHPSE